MSVVQQDLRDALMRRAKNGNIAQILELSEMPDNTKNLLALAKRCETAAKNFRRPDIDFPAMARDFEEFAATCRKVVAELDK